MNEPIGSTGQENPKVLHSGSREEDNSGRNGMSRRVLLRTLMWASAGLFTLQAGLASLGMVWPRKVSGFGSIVKAGRVDDFPVNTVTRVREGKFYISRVPEGLIALYWKCTHLGCTVPWVETEGQFHCPCHSSTYNRVGKNTGGPAPRPMDRMAVEIKDSFVFVDTGVIRARADFTPGQLTKV